MNTTIKRLLCLAAILALTFSVFYARAEDQANTVLFDAFRSLYGNIAFTLDGLSMRAFDADLPTDAAVLSETGLYGGWKNKLQLISFGDSSEVQVHLAEIGDMIAYAEAHPEAGAGPDARMRALFNFAMICLEFSYENSFTAEEPEFFHAGEDDTFPAVRFAFTYNDGRNEPYSCTAILDGERAALLFGSRGARLNSLLEEFRPATREDLEKIEKRLQPKQVKKKSLVFSFPAEPVLTGNFTNMYWHCFTDHFTYIRAEFMGFDFEAVTGEKGTDDALLAFCELSSDGYLQEGDFDSYDVELFAPGIAVLKLHMKDTGPKDRMECWFFVTKKATYMALVNATEEGMAFLESIRPAN